MEKNLELLTGSNVDRYTTDLVFQIIGPDNTESKLGMIQFYGDIVQEVAYANLLKIEDVLKRTYLVIGTLRPCTDPLSAGARSLLKIMEDRNSNWFYWLHAAWSVISQHHPLLRNKDLISLSFVVAGISQVRPVPEVPSIESIDPEYLKMTKEITWTEKREGSQIIRFFPKLAQFGKKKKKIKQQQALTNHELNLGNWRFAVRTWNKLVRHIRVVFPVLKIDVSNLSINVFETTHSSSITVGDGEITFTTPFSYADLPSRVIARGLIGYNLLLLRGTVKIPETSLGVITQGVKSEILEDSSSLLLDGKSEETVPSLRSSPY